MSISGALKISFYFTDSIFYPSVGHLAAYDINSNLMIVILSVIKEKNVAIFPSLSPNDRKLFHG
ncbi:hypothetical protein [Yersinia bercovieri]|uniref:hypothetical protein n=1 Tax=Yersinia bercovieri TaxID=634 RepID=UPI001643EA68|nr:hypothetical protein [Yersinia bercovieri]